jgi:hypothetical protein
MIRSAWQQGHNGTPNIGVHFRYTGGNNLLELRDTYVCVQDFIVEIASADNNSYVCDADEDYTKMIGMIIAGADGGSKVAEGIQVMKDQGICVNCLVQDCDGNGYYIRGDHRVYNNTAVNNVGDGYNQDGGSPILVNCIGDGNGTDFTGTWAAGTKNNASSDGTAPGTSSRINQTFTYVDAGNDDFHLASTDAGAKDYGADLSADSFFPFDDDVNFGLMGAGKAGQTRS